MFRTGDQAVATSGVLEFLGRQTDEIILRGYRVDTRQVETALKNLPGTSDASVVVCREGVVTVAMVGFVVAEAFDERDGRRILAKQLAPHEIPQRIVAIVALPLTPDGKVDRHSLRGLARAALNPRGRALPRTRAEEILTQICSNVLGVAGVSPEDVFLQLPNASSLTAMQVAFRIESQLNTEFSAAPLLGDEPLAVIAASLEGGSR